MDRYFSHLCHDLVQGDRLIVKTLSIDEIRIIPLLNRTVEIFLFKIALSPRPSSSGSTGSIVSRGIS